MIENFTCPEDDPYYGLSSCQLNNTRYSATGCNGVDTVLTCIDGEVLNLVS